MRKRSGPEWQSAKEEEEWHEEARKRDHGGPGRDRRRVTMMRLLSEAGWEGLELEEEGGLSIGGMHSNQRGL